MLPDDMPATTPRTRGPHPERDAQGSPKMKGVYREKELMSPRATAGPKIKAIRHHDIPIAPTGRYEAHSSSPLLTTRGSVDV